VTVRQVSLLLPSFTWRHSDWFSSWPSLS